MTDIIEAWARFNGFCVIDLYNGKWWYCESQGFCTEDIVIRLCKEEMSEL